MPADRIGLATHVWQYQIFSRHAVFLTRNSAPYFVSINMYLSSEKVNSNVNQVKI
jgi:hypothetical protein